MEGQEQLEVCMWQVHLFYRFLVPKHRQAPNEDMS